MLSTWGGRSDLDTISQDELNRVGFDACVKYCKEYCYYDGVGYCPYCALYEESMRRLKAGENL